jgi:O-antigen/teichoic acid export membrane protein
VIRGTFDAFYRSQTRMAFPTVTMAVDSMMLLVAVLVLPASFRDPVSAMILYTGSNIIGAAILFGGSMRFARQLNTEPVRATWAGMRELVTTSAPLAVFLLLNAAHTTVDSIYLKLFHGPEAVAAFNAPMRIMTPLAVFPTIIAISAAPLIARASAGAMANVVADSERLSRLFSLGFKTLLIGAVIIAGFGITNSEWLVTEIFKESYSDSALPMALLFLTFLPMSLNIFLVEVNNARDRLRMNTRFAAVLAIVSITIGALFTSQWAASGAAAAKLTAVVAGLAFLIMRAREGIHFTVKPLVWKGALLFAVLMALRIGLDPVNFWLANVSALVAVTAGIFLLRVYSREEMVLWKTQISGLLRRQA